MSDIDASTEILGLIRDALNDAAGRIDVLADALPALPDAGDASADVAAILAELLHRAGELGSGSHVGAQVVELTRAAYVDADTAVAEALRAAGGR